MSSAIDALVVTNDPVAELRSRQPNLWVTRRNGVIFLLYLVLICPFIVLYKPWDLRRRFAALRLKIHDTLGTYFFQKETAQSLARREGDCNRCGACCHILYRCPYLKPDGENFKCGIYGSRPDQCATFPHDERSLELLQKMDVVCSYSFRPEVTEIPKIVEMLKN